MMWSHGISWHWLESLVIIFFWLLIILLALAPTKYLRDALMSQEMRSGEDDGHPQEGGNTDVIFSTKKRSENKQT